MLLRQVGLKNLKLILYCSRETTFLRSISKNNINVSLHSDINLLFSFKLGMLMDATEHQYLIPVYRSNQGHERMKSSMFTFVQIFLLIKLNLLPQPDGLLKLMINLFSHDKCSRESDVHR